MLLQSLSGKWRVAQAGKSGDYPATVPGCIHTDLIAARVIKDPFYRDQEFDAYWVAEKEWRYSRTFNVTAGLLANDRVLLRCHGLDTLATILVNGTKIGTTDNMFRLYEFDVKKLLCKGKNRIEIRFTSALNYTLNREAVKHLPGWNNNEKIGVHGYIRKEQCNFGWDWGIRTVTCGIWRDLELVAFSQARLSDVHIKQDHKSKKRVDLQITAIAESLGKTDGLSVEAVVLHNDEVVCSGQADLSDGTGRLGLTVKNPEFWWPNTMGDQPLYNITVTLQSSDGARLDSWNRRIGLRTLLLDRHPDQWGESFQFVVNGVPFFAKGANWIPADAYNNRMTSERYSDLIKSAAWANMNMLRVWGGGLYEEDVFYDLCDEYGICIWQDFLFACSTYPTYDEQFLVNVEHEAVENIRRLRHHPSMALWCGNNELEQGSVGPEWTEKTMSWADYSKLYDVLLPRLVAEFDGVTDYWPASPHSPCGDRSDHSNPTCGDAHLWDVWHGMEPFEWYRTCEHRFNSEFGFQSFTEPRTTYGFTAPEDRNVTSYVMEHHQRSGIGNSTIMHYMLDWFRLPSGFENTLWASQILQGMAIKYAVEHWRRSMPRGMGTLYWQLNDTWPVASWASIDYHHRWKALHYMARKFFAPLLLSGLEDSQKGTVEIHLTHDELIRRELTLKWVITNARGKKIDSGEKAVTTGRNANKKVHTLRPTQLLADYGARDFLVWIEAYDGKRKVAENLVTFARPKHLLLSGEPGVIAEVTKAPVGKVTGTGRTAESEAFKVTLKSKAVALWTWIELVDTDFRTDDNFVHVRPGAPVTLTVIPHAALATPDEPTGTPATVGKMTLTQFKKALIVRSLADLSR